MLDYKAIAYTHGINNDKVAKRTYAKALDITRKTAGDIPQDKLERDFGDELIDNYQDLLRSQDKGKYRESKENDTMKNKTKVREFLEDGMDLDALIEGYDLNEAESYSQDMLNKNTVKGKDLEDEKEEACKSKKKEYAGDDGKENMGDLDNDKANGYGSEYFDSGENSYGTEDSKSIDAKADPYATENPDSVDIGESAVRANEAVELLPISQEEWLNGVTKKGSYNSISLYGRGLRQLGLEDWDTDEKGKVSIGADRLWVESSKFDTGFILSSVIEFSYLNMNGESYCLQMPNEVYVTIRV